MNKFIDTDPIKIYYRKGNKHNTAQYMVLDNSHQTYLRWAYSMLYGHIKHFKDENTFQKQLYLQFFFCEQKTLPRPTRLKRGYNTYATFLEGLEDNFMSGTNDFTAKQLPHLEVIANMAYNYFTGPHIDWEPTMNIHKVDLVPFSKPDKILKAR